ncbi:MAG: (E)-4-hydroxy-3-methylbut-2-enyl-diphosphate synthase [Elusimicrobia bacterium]|nr:(E)-4-hydroxy-3-methylbut-2-enyl-diphosphate synthase [Elusimicrobiota bacterium]MDE2236527.1 (E)-4-hydroxy-3-methylbut-2-enyl-diphosphate synthase [Elusimicrobiota bacterium]MDE2426423.1 (E)-4-hydroxy-3-methylbut-2-enyl-diphosphate synthase [Elusimicrobiota bacterium]
MPETAAAARYCPDLFSYRRRRAREVMVGRVGVGAGNPIRLQSMTTTDTLDVEATVAQSIRMIEAGCEIVRITAPTVKDARALGEIRRALDARGFSATPLAADIHFSPAAALEAADFAEKVRINPGNFVDTKRFAVKEYGEAEYEAELLRIEERFTPLVLKLKRLKRALRIGTNHGSLSDRIMNRYGDSPLGMVESSLEFVRVCEKNDFRDIIISMKSSNPKVMIEAYRLLAARMDELGMDYPFHLGVTEAGGGEDGRVKSAIGIGALLADGIGDTIRVSLTEDPEIEIPVCRRLAAPYQRRAEPAPRPECSGLRHCADFYSYSRRKATALKAGPFALGGSQPPRVVASLGALGPSSAAELLGLLEAQLKRGQGGEPELIRVPLRGPADVEALGAMRAALSCETSRLALLAAVEGPESLALAALPHADALAWRGAASAALLGALKAAGLPLLIEAASLDEALKASAAARAQGVAAWLSLVAPDSVELLPAYRLLAARGGASPIHIRVPACAGEEELILRASVLIGGLLCDGVGDSVELSGSLALPRALELSYNVLQGAGARVVKTEYVSCPSCGRTLFDLQSTTERLKARTGHLKGVKIAIMGCIVNGPGEMADADFGYVGGAPGRINLYVGKDCVQKGIPTEQADQALIDLIKRHGKWVEPKPA